MKLFSISPLIFLSSLLLFNRYEPAPKMATVYIQFNHNSGSQPLVLNGSNYTNAAGEQFTISNLQYFVSNIKLRDTKGKEYVIKQDSSYFLINESSPGTKLVRISIPEGDYDRLDFVLGVDSVRNTMPIGKRTGVLDPANAMDHGMYWGWNSGYIFFKMEGNSPQAPVDPSGQRKFRYHIGGFGGYSAPTINNIKNISLNLAQNGIVKARKDAKTTVQVNADIQKTFDGKNVVSIAAHPSVMFSEYSVNIANNYSQMFSHIKTE